MGPGDRLLSEAPFRIRTATPDDAEALAAVHVASWRAAFRGLMPPAFLEGLSEPAAAARFERGLRRDPLRGRETFVSVNPGGSLSGYCTAGPDPEDRARGLVFMLYVIEANWGDGSGLALLDAGTERLAGQSFRDARLWVLEGNARARRFYEREGWLQDGASRLDDYGGLQLRALRYVRRLTPIC